MEGEETGTLFRLFLQLCRCQVFMFGLTSLAWPRSHQSRHAMEPLWISSIGLYNLYEISQKISVKAFSGFKISLYKDWKCPIVWLWYSFLMNWFTWTKINWCIWTDAFVEYMHLSFWYLNLNKFISFQSPLKKDQSNYAIHQKCLFFNVYLAWQRWI